MKLQRKRKTKKKRSVWIEYLPSGGVLGIGYVCYGAEKPPKSWQVMQKGSRLRRFVEVK